MSTCRDRPKQVIRLVVALLVVLVAGALPGCRCESVDETDDDGTAAGREGAPASQPVDEEGDPPPLLERVAAADGPTLLPFGASELPDVPVTLDVPLGRPDQYGAVVASASGIAVAYEVRRPGDECRTEGLERCHRLSLATRPWGAESETVHTTIAESDSPGGVGFDALVPFGTEYVVVWRDGRYSGDDERLVATFVSPTGGVATGPIELLGGVSTEVERSDAVELPDGSGLVCWSGDDVRENEGLDVLRNRRVWCRHFDRDAASDTAGLITSGRGEHRVPALAWFASPQEHSAEDGEPAATASRGLLLWVREETLEGVIIDDRARPVGDVIALGAAAVRRPGVVAAHGGFLVVWQSVDGPLRAQRVELDGRRWHEPLDLGPLGARFQPPDDVAAVPDGFLVAFDDGGTPRLALVDPAGRIVDEVPTVREKERTLLGSRSALDVTPADEGHLVWRRAGRLLEDARPKDPPARVQPPDSTPD